jgi:hypothetical protein
MCSYKRGEQTIEHILFGCGLVDQGRGRIKVAVLRAENRPVSKEILINKYRKKL